MSLIGRSVAAALRPAPNPPAVWGALRALAAAGVIAVLGAWRGDLQVVGVAYLGAACAVSFTTAPVYRNRLIGLLAQGAGAAVGIAVGATVPDSALVLVLTASVAGVVSGVIGQIGPSGPAFGMMLSIGVAFGQFGGSTLTWSEQSLWYVIGTMIAGLTALVTWIVHRGTPQRRAAADVLSAAADLCEALGTDQGRPARMRLAAASAAAREAGHFPAAELTAFAAAALYADGCRVPRAAIDAIRAAGSQVLAGVPVDVRVDTGSGGAGLSALADALSAAPWRPPAPPKRRLLAVVRSTVTGDAVANGMRMALCLGVATAVTVALDRPAHGFWLPLTVAVIVRPEYASVFTRTVNRLAGTVAGAAVAAVLLWFLPPGLGVAAAAAVALSLAVCSAPKLYALYVIGVTTSTLLAASIGRVEPILPLVRVSDTVMGAVIAVTCGYLLWPGARRLPGSARLDRAVIAGQAYLAEAAKAPPSRVRLQARRDDAYRLAHQVRSASQAALIEPLGVSDAALQIIPTATRLEDLIDAVTAVATTVDSGIDATARVAELTDELAALAP
jgi:hypothetical protein